MSYQLLHVLSHGCSLHKDRGQLVMRPYGGGAEKRCVLEDVRAIIIAARGVSFSSDLLSALCRNGTVVLHCDEKYCPCGITAPLMHTTRTALLQSQCRQSSLIHRKLWAKIVHDKIENQSRVLQIFDLGKPVPRTLEEQYPDEAAAARYYWRLFFTELGGDEQKRSREDAGQINAMLNYGYAVLTALVHRAVVAHGMLPELGIHHKPSFNGNPMVYDLMEPLRPFVDALLVQFLRKKLPDDEAFPQWCRFVAKGLLQMTAAMPEGRMKLLYALDVYVEIAARCLEEDSVKEYWSLKFEEQSVQDGMDHDDVRSAGHDGGRTP